jgi:galactokinase
MDTFEQTFRRAPVAVASAPGRVNLMGEHTDYNGGLVLPTALPLATTVAVAPRPDDHVNVVTTLAGVAATGSYRLGGEARAGAWLDYVQGCTWALARDGHRLGGFDAAIASSLPAGSGLASSAALAVACLRALRATLALALDDVALALVAHRAERDFVGAPVGVMDQMAASLGDETSALLLDTVTLAIERVPLPPAVELVVIDSGVRHAIAGGEYARRRAECERAARLIGVARLCEAAIDDLARLPPPLARRARHVVAEHARVRATAAALAAGDAATLGRLFRASHASQRDDFEVSVPAVDRLVALADADPDVHGARLTGGGFGGSIVVLARRGSGAAVGTRVARAAGGAARVVVPLTT